MARATSSVLRLPTICTGANTGTLALNLKECQPLIITTRKHGPVPPILRDCRTNLSHDVVVTRVALELSDVNQMTLVDGLVLLVEVDILPESGRPFVDGTFNLMRCVSR